MRPLQVSYISILMLLLFGTFIFSESGKFILPLGIYKPLFTVAVTIQFFLIKNRRKVFLPVLVGSFFLLLTSRFVLELFLNEEELFRFVKSGYTDWAMLFFVTVWLVWGIVIFLPLRKTLRGVIFLAGNMIFSAALLLNLEELAVAGLLLSTAAFFGQEELEDVYAINLLSLFLLASATITGLVYGKLAVMMNL